MSGGSDRASREAQRNEEARQAAIRGTQGAVNNVFDSPGRAADIADYVGALREHWTGDLNKQKSDTDRELKFALARSGQAGGSTQIDQNRNVAEDYTKGLLTVDRKARGAGAQLEASDEDARARLISLATTGLDATSAASMAASAMRTNLESGRSAAELQGLGTVFGSGLQDYFKQVADRDQRRKANKDLGYSLYGSTGYGGP